MGFTAMIVGGLAAGAVVSKALTPKAPTINMPDPEPMKTDPAADLKTATGAAEQTKKRATAAGAVGSTILTGPQGLGEVTSAQQGKKNLLGY